MCVAVVETKSRVIGCLLIWDDFMRYIYGLWYMIFRLINDRKLLALFNTTMVLCLFWIKNHNYCLLSDYCCWQNKGITIVPFFLFVFISIVTWSWIFPSDQNVHKYEQKISSVNTDNEQWGVCKDFLMDEKGSKRNSWCGKDWPKNACT